MNTGDKVVCVDDSPCRCGRTECTVLMPVVKGRVYVVAETFVLEYWDRSWLILVLVGVGPSPGHREGVSALRFRLLDEMKAQASTATLADAPGNLG